MATVPFVGKFDANLISSMRCFNIWVKKGFFNHFPNSSVASRKERAFSLLFWVPTICYDMFLHIIVH